MNEESILFNDSSLKREINLESTDWNQLLNLCYRPFIIEEKIRPCVVYKNNILPGGKLSSKKGIQVFTIENFYNYMEFSKIMEDEVVEIKNVKYLTTEFFKKRQKGWALKETTTKKGKLLCYYVNGMLFHPSKIDKILSIFYEVVYYSLVQNLVEFKLLLKYVKDKTSLILRCKNKDFLQNFKNLLLAKSED